MNDKSEQPQQQSDSQPKQRLNITLLSSPEGRLFLFGAGLAFVYILWLGIMLLFSPDLAQILVGMTATGTMFGRAAAMAFGYSLGLDHSMVIPVCMLIETVLVLIFYPLFVFSWRHLLVIKRLKKIFERIHKIADIRKEKVQKYGLIGLFIFVWFPFWMTGPVVGCVIGFLLGMRLWQNIIIVLAGTYTAIVGWAFLLHEFHERVASYSSYAAIILMVLLLFIIVIGHFLQKKEY